MVFYFYILPLQRLLNHLIRRHIPRRPITLSHRRTQNSNRTRLTRPQHLQRIQNIRSRTLGRPRTEILRPHSTQILQRSLHNLFIPVVLIRHLLKFQVLFIAVRIFTGISVVSFQVGLMLQFMFLPRPVYQKFYFFNVNI